MADPIATLTISQVKAAARKAHAEKRLIAQYPGEDLKYRNTNGHVCAIGAALTPEQAEAIQKLNYVFIDTLISYETIISPDLEAATELRNIQRAHDRWSGSITLIPTVAASDVASQHEAAFLELIK